MWQTKNRIHSNIDNSMDKYIGDFKVYENELWKGEGPRERERACYRCLFSKKYSNNKNIVIPMEQF